MIYRNDIYAIRYSLLEVYKQLISPTASAVFFVQPRNSCPLSQTIKSTILATTHLMPRRAPLRADPLPVLICCSRRQPTPTLLRDPSAQCLIKVLVPLYRGHSSPSPRFRPHLTFLHGSAQTESPLKDSLSRARQAASFGRNLQQHSPLCVVVESLLLLLSHGKPPPKDN